MNEQIVFIRYSSKYKSSVEKKLIPRLYLQKYTNKLFPYNILNLLNMYKNELYLLVKLDVVLGSILIRRRISYKSFKQFWWIYGVYINNNFRGQGFGEEIIKEALIWLKKQNAEVVYLYVGRKNVTAINLYTKCGFTVVEKSKYHKIPLNQLLMMKILNV